MAGRPSNHQGFGDARSSPRHHATANSNGAQKEGFHSKLFAVADAFNQPKLLQLPMLLRPRNPTMSSQQPTKAWEM